MNLRMVWGAYLRKSPVNLFIRQLLPMKKNYCMILVPILFSGILFAQETSPEAEVRLLEEKERQAVLKKDTAALRKLWDRYFLVNAPTNRVVPAGPDVVSRPVIQLKYASFTREIEQILVRGDVVFSMGNEVIIPDGDDDPRKGKEIRRRYTNIWMKHGTTWTLVARHASEICQ